eukprot:scaffold111179_cov64-Cyclotella_meneghiniana.AAC.3
MLIASPELTAAATGTVVAATGAGVGAATGCGVGGAAFAGAAASTGAGVAAGAAAGVASATKFLKAATSASSSTVTMMGLPTRRILDPKYDINNYRYLYGNVEDSRRFDSGNGQSTDELILPS